MCSRHGSSAILISSVASGGGRGVTKAQLLAASVAGRCWRGDGHAAKPIASWPCKLTWKDGGHNGAAGAEEPPCELG